MRELGDHLSVAMGNYIQLLKQEPRNKKAIDEFLSVYGINLFFFSLFHENYAGARFLIEEIEIDKETLIDFCLFMKSKVENQRDLLDFMNYIGNIYFWRNESENVCKGYYLSCLIKAIELNDIDTVKFLTDNFPDNRYLEDEHGNSLLHIATSKNNLTMVKHLVKTGWYIPLLYRNNDGLTPFELAKQLNFYEILDYLEKKYDSKTLDIFEREITDKSIHENDDIGVKGIALILHYYSKKRNKPIVLIYDDAEGTKLINFISYFVNSNNQLQYVFYGDGGHFSLYVLEKLNNKCYVTIVDSLVTWTSKYDFLTCLSSEEFEHLKDKIIFCKSESVQQTAESGCRIFALKNFSIAAKFQSFTTEILQEKYFIRSEVDSGVEMIFYRLPPAFMHIASSPRQLKNYILDNEDSHTILRTNKAGEKQDLLLWFLQWRDKYGVQTPRIMANKAYDPTSEDIDKHSPYVIQNNSITFFKCKYVKSVIPNMLSTHTQAELREIISCYDARNMTNNNTPLQLTHETSRGVSNR